MLCLPQHHPDKQQPGASPALDGHMPRITHAYGVLSVPSARAEYDATLKRREQAALAASTSVRISAEVDIDAFELVASADDVQEQAAQLRFKLDCRCGSAYVVELRELEAGHDLVGCSGCSLVIRVLLDAPDGAET
jgi:DnaJ-class molecular chaperone